MNARWWMAWTLAEAVLKAGGCVLATARKPEQIADLVLNSKRPTPDV
jgi:phosphopantetheinyl transferase